MMFPNDDVPDHLDKNIAGDDFRPHLDKMCKLREQLAALGHDDFAAIVLSLLLERTTDSDQDKDKGKGEDKGKGKDKDEGKGKDEDENNNRASFWKSISSLFLGVPSLGAIGELEGKAFEDLKDVLLERTKNLTVVATLAVSAAASFLTTSPPNRHMAWDNDLPYIFILLACGSAGLSVASGLCLIMYLGIMTQKSIKVISVNPGSLRYLAISALMTMPIFFVWEAGVCVIFALLGAIWYGDTLWMKIFVSAGVLVGVMLVIALALALPYHR